MKRLYVTTLSKERPKAYKFMRKLLHDEDMAMEGLYDAAPEQHNLIATLEELERAIENSWKQLSFPYCRILLPDYYLLGRDRHEVYLILINPVPSWIGDQLENLLKKELGEDNVSRVKIESVGLDTYANSIFLIGM